MLFPVRKTVTLAWPSNVITAAPVVARVSVKVVAYGTPPTRISGVDRMKGKVATVKVPLLLSMMMLLSGTLGSVFTNDNTPPLRVKLEAGKLPRGTSPIKTLAVSVLRGNSGKPPGSRSKPWNWSVAVSIVVSGGAALCSVPWTLVMMNKPPGEIFLFTLAFPLPT